MEQSTQSAIRACPQLFFAFNLDEIRHCLSFLRLAKGSESARKLKEIVSHVQRQHLAFLKGTPQTKISEEEGCSLDIQVLRWIAR